MKLINNISKFALEYLLNAATEGEKPDISAAVHKFLTKDPKYFQEQLLELLKLHEWEETKPLLKLLCNTKIKSWIPEFVLPSFTFIDLERNPNSSKINEFAIGITNNLEEEPSVFDKVFDEIEDYKVKYIQNLIEKHHNTNWLVGHNIKEFDYNVLINIGVFIKEKELLDTLELSLIIYPLQSKHALEGDHKAKGDVLKNIKLFWELDKEYLNLDMEEIDKHILWQQNESGMQRYLINIKERKKYNLYDKNYVSKNKINQNDDDYIYNLINSSKKIINNVFNFFW